MKNEQPTPPQSQLHSSGIKNPTIIAGGVVRGGIDQFPRSPRPSDASEDAIPQAQLRHGPQFTEPELEETENEDDELVSHLEMDSSGDWETEQKDEIRDLEPISQGYSEIPPYSEDDFVVDPSRSRQDHYKDNEGDEDDDKSRYSTLSGLSHIVMPPPMPLHSRMALINNVLRDQENDRRVYTPTFGSSNTRRSKPMQI